MFSDPRECNNTVIDMGDCQKYSNKSQGVVNQNYTSKNKPFNQTFR